MYDWVSVRQASDMETCNPKSNASYITVDVQTRLHVIKTNPLGCDSVSQLVVHGSVPVLWLNLCRSV
jgi:hypothetical protein